MQRLFLFLLLTANLLLAQNENRPLPPGFPAYEFELHELAFSGHYFAIVYQLNPATKTDMFVLDSLGYITWYKKNREEAAFDFKYQSNANMLTAIGYTPGAAGTFYTFDPYFQPLDTLYAANGERGDTHDFLALANGNKIIGTQYDTIMDLSDYSFSGITGSVNTTVRGYGLQEFDAAHQLLWSWHSTDFVHPGEFSDGLTYNVNDFNYSHGNAFSLDDDGNLLLSLRNTSTIYKIDRVGRSGEVLWRLGGEQSDFEFPEQADAFTTQHHVNRLPNGEVSLYDNGNLRTPAPYSRAVTYSLDLSNSTASRSWTYDADASIYASAMGNVHWLGDSLALIGWGNVRRPSPTFSLVRRSGEVAAQLYYEDSFVSYRIAPAVLPFTLPRPQLTYELQNDSIVISAPPGYDEYVWSNGATTSTITVAEAGLYQVWVPYGIGMLGSYPLDLAPIVRNETIPLRSFRVFPNPATTSLCIDFEFEYPTPFDVILYNSSGRPVKTFEGANSHWQKNIDTSALPWGVYFLQIETRQGVMTTRIVLL